MLRPEVLRDLREKKGLSHEYIAGKLKLSRPSYVLIESGQKEPTLTQAKILAELLDITLDSLIKGEPVAVSEVHLGKNKKAKGKAETTLRVSIPQKNLRKFKEVLLYILEKVGGKPNVGQTVLYKLLYFIDFDYYEKFEEQLIGATYIKNHFGPTPVEFAKVMSRMIEEGEAEEVKSTYFKHEQKKYLARKSPDLSVLTVQEKDHIDDVLARFSDKTATTLSAYSHGDVPWKVAKDGEEIKYEMVFYRSDAYSVAPYEEL